MPVMWAEHYKFIVPHMYAVGVGRIRTTASRVDFEMFANCFVHQQSDMVTQVQSAETHQKYLHK